MHLIKSLWLSGGLEATAKMTIDNIYMEGTHYLLQDNAHWMICGVLDNNEYTYWKRGEGLVSINHLC